MTRRWSAVAAAMCAAVLAFSGWAIVSSDGGVSDRVPVTFGVVPTSAPPAAAGAPAPLATDAVEPGATDAVEPGAIDAEAPAAAESSRPSSIPVPKVAVAPGSLASLQGPPAAAPVAIRIVDIAVDAAVERVGYDTATDAMEVPRSREIVGWYEHGPAPGEQGSAVLAAHVDWNRRPGAFHDLVDVRPGTEVAIDYDDGTRRYFSVIALDRFSKPDLPVEQIFAKDGPAVLTLITCGGDFDRTARSYRDNVVVWAVEVPTPAQDIATL